MHNRYSALSTSYSVNWSIASSMSSKLEPVIWLRDTGHIGIHEGKTLDNNDLDQVESAILEVSCGFSHKNALEAHQNGGERVECSTCRIHSVFSLENVLKSVSTDFTGKSAGRMLFK